MDLLGQRIIRGDESVMALVGQLGAYPDDHVQIQEKRTAGYKDAA